MNIHVALEEVRNSRLLINQLDEWIFQEIRPYLGRRIIEVGCGHGNFIGHFLASEIDLVGATDVEPASVQLVQTRYGSDSRFKSKTYDICAPVDDEVASWRADTVFSINVLEHVENDQLAMRHMAELLVPGGCALLIVPAHPWAYGTMDRSIGHFRRYTKATVAEKMRQAGWVVDRQFYLNMPGLLGWFVNAKLLKKTVPPEGQLKMFNRLVPLIRCVEQLIRPPCGTSVVTIAYREVMRRGRNGLL